MRGKKAAIKNLLGEPGVKESLFRLSLEVAPPENLRTGSGGGFTTALATARRVVAFRQVGENDIGAAAHRGVIPLLTQRQCRDIAVDGAATAATVLVTCLDCAPNDAGCASADIA